MFTVYILFLSRSTVSSLSSSVSLSFSEAPVWTCGGTVQWGQWCVQTVKAERKPPSAAAAHSTAYIFPIGPLSCHLELLKVTLLHGCIYKEIPHSGSVSRGKRRPPALLNSCVTLQAKPSASQVRPSKYWCYTLLRKFTVKQFLPEWAESAGWFQINWLNTDRCQPFRCSWQRFSSS